MWLYNEPAVTSCRCCYWWCLRCWSVCLEFVLVIRLPGGTGGHLEKWCAGRGGMVGANNFLLPPCTLHTELAVSCFKGILHHMQTLIIYGPQYVPHPPILCPTLRCLSLCPSPVSTREVEYIEIYNYVIGTVSTYHHVPKYIYDFITTHLHSPGRPPPLVMPVYERRAPQPGQPPPTEGI